MGYQQLDQHMHYGSPRSKRGRERVEKIFEEIMAAIFSNLMKHMNLQIQNAQTNTSGMNPKRTQQDAL